MLSAGLCLPKEAKEHEGCSALPFLLALWARTP